MTITRRLFAGLAFTLLGVLSAFAGGGQQDQKTILTFSGPFEVPGHVLPAGTYTFQLVDSLSDRHIVQISSADGSRPIATVLAIANNRLTATEKTVITFNEVPVGATETLRAWFYPGLNIGQEFVYPKRRALQLAATSKVTVPAIAADVPEPDLKTAAIVAVTPEQREVPLASVMPAQQDAVVAPVVSAPRVPEQTLASAATQDAREQDGRQLPRTASSLPLVALFGLMSLGAAVALMYVNRPVRGTGPVA